MYYDRNDGPQRATPSQGISSKPKAGVGEGIGVRVTTNSQYEKKNLTPFDLLKLGLKAKNQEERETRLNQAFGGIKTS